MHSLFLLWGSGFSGVFLCLRRFPIALISGTAWLTDINVPDLWELCSEKSTENVLTGGLSSKKAHDQRPLCERLWCFHSCRLVWSSCLRLSCPSSWFACYTWHSFPPPPSGLFCLHYYCCCFFHPDFSIQFNHVGEFLVYVIYHHQECPVPSSCPTPVWG